MITFGIWAAVVLIVWYVTFKMGLKPGEPMYDYAQAELDQFMGVLLMALWTVIMLCVWLF